LILGATLLAAPAFTDTAVAQSTAGLVPAPDPQQPAPRAERVPLRRAMPLPMGDAVTPAPHPPGDLGKWWKSTEIVKELALTDQQVSQIEQTFLEHRLKLIDLKADVERNEARLQPLIEADTVDEVKISAQLDQMLTARSRLEKANIMMMLSIRKTLSVDQWKKLEAIRQERERPMWFEKRGPGAGAGFGPGPGPGGMVKRRTSPAPPRPPESDPPQT
jgi:Spy/CpxP family protein refolding chaperone